MPSQCPLCGKFAFAPSKFSGFYCFPSSDGCGMVSQVDINIFNGLLHFNIGNNSFLNINIDAYSHGLYIPYKSRYATDLTYLILDLKGTTDCDINLSRLKAAQIIQNDLDIIIRSFEKYNKSRLIVLAMARAKPNNFYDERMLQFRTSISMAVQNSSIKSNNNEVWPIDGVYYINRVIETKTTHLAKSSIENNNGSLPYPGITKETCILNGDINNKCIILVDDIYTHNVGVDEDCIQYLYDNGARDVILYTLGLTVTPPKN